MEGTLPPARHLQSEVGMSRRLILLPAVWSEVHLAPSDSIQIQRAPSRLTGEGSLLDSSNLYLGGTDTDDGGVGTLNITNNGRVRVGNDEEGLRGVGLFTISSNVAGEGNLVVRNGSSVTNFENAIIGESSNYTGTVTVNGEGSEWNNSLDLFVGSSWPRIFKYSKMAVRYRIDRFGAIGRFSGSTGSTVTVDGSGSLWDTTNLFLGGTSTEDGGVGTLNITNNGRVRVGNDSAGLAGTGVFTISSNVEGEGNLVVRNGSKVNNTGNSGFAGRAIIGESSNYTGNVTVNGAGSEWNNTSDLFVGDGGQGFLNIQNGGKVSNRDGYIGYASSSTGSVTVTGGSQWINSGTLTVGRGGSGILNVEAGGVVRNTTGFIGRIDGTTGTVTVTGSGHWDNSGNLYVGGDSANEGGTATLSINQSGLVTVGGTTRIWDGANVNLEGGRFEFGTTDLTSFGRIGGSSGELAGAVEIYGFNDIADQTVFQNSTLDISDVQAGNHGVLYGSGNLITGIKNYSDGEVEIIAGERMRFLGNSNSNEGEINNFGGNLRFVGTLANKDGGKVNGYGQFIANGGWTNEVGGLIQFSNGNASILGDFVNDGDGTDIGTVITTGGYTTTFFGNVVNNGEIRTSLGDSGTASATVIFGTVSGTGAFTGEGDVYIEGGGELNPGGSPGILRFQSNLYLGTNSEMLIEIGGLGYGEFDRIEVGGDLYLNGLLNATMWDDYQLAFNQEFVFADVQGNVFGQFQNFDEGALVGNFNGVDLFITYLAGDGNDVGFFSAIPEPSSVVLFLGIVLGFGFVRRRSA